MATLNNTRISDTYHGLIKTLDNTAISATLKQLSDGDGNVTGLYLNNAGDFKVTAILEFGSLKDTAENIVISKFVDAADGIGNNNNDTSIPTSKAIIDYVAGQITAEDLDFRGDDSTVLGDVDLNSQAFIILGTANEIETSVTSAGGNTLKIGIPSNPVLTGIVTATTFSGDLNGTINTATTATTQSAGDNSTKVATTAYVDTLDAASDLDFSGDSGTGDVTLNTQTFAITGTTNQVTTSASNETLNISLPSTVHRNLQGNVVGNLTGDVTGNVAGDLTGNVTASSVLANGVTATTQASSDNSTKVATTAYVKGLDNASDLDITDGSNTGDVNLNTQSLSILGTSSQVVSTVSNQSVTLSLPSSINVNSASATILQNARDISLTGEASGTISSFNGSANVSGAVTLDNDSVTGKVLTGLASPTATNILASDSILQAFGKTQSQLNTLAGGLRFMGTWNATTNTPTLTSGGGESASGTTTGTTANKLVDSSGGFTSAVDGDQVVNQASGATATVTNVDSSTVLSLSADIMVSGQEYTIDNSPFLSQGHYFVVSVGGTSSLNGLSNWAVGDWVIAGATNVWEKLDHTQVDGTGTVGNITKWSSTNVIADSIMAESGSTITATGSIAATQLLSSGGNFAVNTNKFTANATTGNVAFTGDLAVNTNKFTANATSGNVAFTGDLAINTNKFTVNATNGNTLVSGNITVSGTSSSFNTGNSGTLVTNDSSGYPRITTTNSNAQLGLFRSGSSAGGMYIGANSGGLEIMTSAFATKFSISNGGDGTFAGIITANSSSSGDYVRMYGSSGTGKWDIYGNGANLRISDNESAGILAVDTGATFGGNVIIGDTTGTSPNSADRFLKIGKSNLQDCSIILQDAVETWEIYQNDNLSFSYGTTPTTVLTLARTTGTATFAGQVSVGNYAIPSDHQFQIAHLGQSYARFALTNSQTGNGSSDGLIFQMESLNSIIKNQENGSLAFGTNGRETDLKIDSSGNVGIGVNPASSFGFSKTLEIQGAANAEINISQSDNSKDWSLGVTDGANYQQTTSGQAYVWQSGGTERMKIDSTGNTTITSTTNQGGLTVTTATDNTVLGISNTATGGQDWRLQSIGGGSGSGQGKLLIKVGGSETAANLISFVTDGSGANIKMGIGTTSPSSYYADKLVVNCSGSEDGITIVNGSYIMFADGTSGDDRFRGQISYSHSIDAMLFATNATEKMRITSGGDIQIPTNSAKIQFRGSGSASYSSISRDASNVIQIANTAGTNIVSIDNGGDTTFAANTSANAVVSRDNMFVDVGQLYIGAGTSTVDNTFRQAVASGAFKIESRKSGTWTQRLMIDTVGDLSTPGNIFVGGGVFLGGTGTANKLDDYEEGTFTATTNNDGVGLQVTANYTKIGQLVTYTVYIPSWSPSAAGTAVIAGFPFTATTTNGYGVGNVTHSTGVLNCSGGYHETTNWNGTLNNSTGRSSWAVASARSIMVTGFYYTTS